MKQLKIILATFFLCWMVPGSVFAQFTETKEISKHFKVSPETRIEIANKYGKIEMNTWEKDSVVINIDIRVEEKKLSRLEKSMDEIKFDITDNQHFLIFRTSVGENRSALEKEFLKFKETLLQTDGNMEINYTVWLPKTNKLKIENKFGDIFIGDYSGEVEIDLSNGNLKSHDFNGRLDLTLNFADATINQMQNGRLDCNYSDLYLRKAESLRIVSKSTTYEILEIKELDADSRRDKFRIRLADLIDAEGSFSNFRINELNDRATLRTEYGDIDVEKTNPDFSNIFIESRSTDINLYFPPDANFGFEITHTKTELDLCREMNIEEENVLDEKENKIELKGSYNQNTNTNTKLFINATSGELNIFSD
ncbi:DUF4097 family beta strand repeat-containing protein [Maribellus maritimus]|uniref:DUF4097 family beta strand repeat-containing protein n=1 Tax=Maribellus maritimus TaxID=2870838 RepID=UPI001EEBD99D|nr:DUF4097 family beta strand repeat-containing protein [Maribellus maritimus]MCG6186633.1 DUF4097 family beta strand repeat-containing protein [Maribellus maritimus]